MNITIERKKTDCSALPKGWQREEVLRKSGLSAGKVDVYYYSPSGGKVETKSKLMRQIGDAVDLSTFDYQSGRHQLAANTFQRNTGSIRCLIGGNDQRASSSPTPSSVSSSTSKPPHQFEFSRGVRTDVSLVPPIRQTASIFKQPVTLHRNQDSKVKSELKHGAQQEKPKQLFWEKRLEGLNACDMDGGEYGAFELPKALKPVGPFVNNATLLQSVATALHVTSQPITGQTAPKSHLATHAGVYLNPEQPLMHSYSISEDDIRRQEDRVNNARKKLQEALRY